MIEPGEQEMLLELAASDAVAEAGLVVEFGCFFGRSTACLVNGASRWWTPGRGEPAVHAFDSFACHDGGGFAHIVGMFATQGDVNSLVRREGGRVDFLPVYRNYLGAAEVGGILKTTVAELRDTTFAGGRIGLVHIDAPKYYEELKPILERFFPSLAPGGAVVFQDYLYHWSASLIAAVQLLVEAGVLTPERTVATALVTRVERAPTVAEIQELDRAMIVTPVEQLIDRGIETLKGVAVDRAAQFLSRVRLAKMQHLWQQGRFREAEETLVEMVRTYGINPPNFNDLRELMRSGFDLRKAYELDH